MFIRSLFVILTFLFWPLSFFDLRILIAALHNYTGFNVRFNNHVHVYELFVHLVVGDLYEQEMSKEPLVIHFISRGDCINYFICLVEIYHWQRQELMTIELTVDVTVIPKITEENNRCNYYHAMNLM
jgi:hypothetical protein